MVRNFAAGMELKSKQRAALGIFFFLSGFCFSTWTSRIPTIKINFAYNDAELGTILLFMPISSMISLPVSGWLVSKFDSKKPLSVAFIVLALALALIGFSTTTVTLVAFLCLFAFSMRILNISMNTQAITLQKLFDRKINGSFHGLWSTGGITGVGFSTLAVTLGIPMPIHLLVAAVITLIATLFFAKLLLSNDRASSGNKLVIGKPDPHILYLGLLVLFAAICEGGMFDWSGVYFKEVVGEEIFTLGYLTFMICMAFSRFISDRLIEVIGMPGTFTASAVLIFTGICLAIIFPYFWPSIIGFCLVGFGTASIIPMTFTLAGTSRKYSPGMAISIIATYGIVGMLVGPPLIGYLSHAFSLRTSFVAFALAGILLIPISRFFFHHQRSLRE